MSSPLVELRIVMPRKVLERIERIEAETGLTKEDIVLRAIVRLLDELEAG